MVLPPREKELTAAAPTVTGELKVVPLEQVATNEAGPVEALLGIITWLVKVPVGVRLNDPKGVVVPF
jgi:hypothetical protein